ncbi:MAG: DUF3105 domain-containing protein [Nitriliruptoraceae bacterium]
MAEKERLTNRERRELAREERRRTEEVATERRKRGNLRNGLATFAIVAVIAAVVLQAFLGGVEDIDERILVAFEDIDEARLAAGCEVLSERTPLPERYHFDANQAPHPDSIYGPIRPTHSGPHSSGVHPITASSSNQISEVSSTHNLEHGSIVIWWDPASTDRSTGTAIGSFAELYNANGFRTDIGGVGILSAPYEEPGISSGGAVAFRAWGTAMDCDEFDETVAQGFLIEHFGTRGIGPERSLAPYPSEVLDVADRDVSDTAPTDESDDAGDEPDEDSEPIG